LSKIKEILHYFIKNYPYKDELSKTRITKMVYLADWKYSLKYYKQMTNIKWYFDHYGPYVNDIYNIAIKDKELEIICTQSAFGNRKELFTFKDNNKERKYFNLDNNEIEVLDEVIEETKYLNWNDFIKHVYSTYPIKTQKRYSTLNLPELAKEHNKNNSIN
jgi:hypothetical protein